MCGYASIWAKIALGLAIIAAIIDLIGWATYSWMSHNPNSSTSTEIGLWQMRTCTTTDGCSTKGVDNSYVSGSLNATRGLETVGLLLAVAVLILVSLYTCSARLRTEAVAWTILVVAAIAGIIIFCGLAVFLTNMPSPFSGSYSMGLTIVAAVLLIVVSILMIPDICMNTDDDDFSDYDRREYYRDSRSRVSHYDYY